MANGDLDVKIVIEPIDFENINDSEISITVTRLDNQATFPILVIDKAIPELNGWTGKELIELAKEKHGGGGVVTVPTRFYVSLEDRRGGRLN